MKREAEKSMGRPVNKEYEGTGIVRWRKLVRNRESWRNVMEKAKTNKKQ